MIEGDASTACAIAPRLLGHEAHRDLLGRGQAHRVAGAHARHLIGPTIRIEMWV